MAAPTPTARGTPAGKKLTKSWKTTVTIAADLTLEFFEQSVTPPGIDGGTPIDTSTMLNTKWKTQSPGRLIMMTDMTIKGYYDPLIYSSLALYVNVITTITLTFPDLSTLAFYGFIKQVAFSELTNDNSKPSVTLTIAAANQDPSTCVEAAPVYTAGPGTGKC